MALNEGGAGNTAMLPSCYVPPSLLPIYVDARDAFSG